MFSFFLFCVCIESWTFQGGRYVCTARVALLFACFPSMSFGVAAAITRCPAHASGAARVGTADRRPFFSSSSLLSLHIETSLPILRC
jgi:hypothetical protein